MLTERYRLRCPPTDGPTRNHRGRRHPERILQPIAPSGSPLTRTSGKQMRKDSLLLVVGHDIVVRSMR